VKKLVLVLTVGIFTAVLVGGARADRIQCQQGTFYLGSTFSPDRTRLTGFCVNWDTGRFVGYLADGDSLVRSTDNVRNLTDKKGRRVYMGPPRSASAPDSLYEALKLKPLNEMTDREYEYFMLQKKAEVEKGSETTTARAAMMTAEATKSWVSTYTVIAVIGIGLSVILLLAAL
jgi:hypothetical protein